MSTYQGRTIDLTISGASHAPEIGVEIHGLPKDEPVNLDELKAFLKRRAPGQNEFSTARKEPDEPVIISGLDENSMLNGEPLNAKIINKDMRSKDYSALRVTPRPGHADYTAEMKYHGTQDANGGGKFSGRMTAPLCIAGGIAKQLLALRGINVVAKVRSIAGITDDEAAMKQAILKAKSEGDSVGGVVSCAVTGMPAGIGGPLFDGIEGELAKMLYAIPAVKGVSFGAGFAAAEMLGSENNDIFAIKDGEVVTETNNAGGILGGISNGMPITMDVAFKPTPSISRKQRTVNLETMENAEIEITGRHDPCIILRAVPVVEAAAAIVMLDMLQEEEQKAKAVPHNTEYEGVTLAECRKRIDEIDSEMTRLFTERMKVSEDVAAYKKANGMKIFDAGRERKKLLSVSSRTEPEYKEFMISFYSLIMQLSRARQGELLSVENGHTKLINDALEKTPKLFPKSAKVACQGIEGAYSQRACDQLFEMADINYYESFDDVFSSIEIGECQYGVIPLENSTAGSVNAVYDLMQKHRFSIVRATRVRVEHCLLAKEGTDMSQIRTIYSHPQAIMQCSRFLGSLENVEVIPCENTAAAAKSVADSERTDIAALSSISCASLYGLNCLKEGVQNVTGNYTRFICIAPELEIYPGANRTSLMLTGPHYKGSLYGFLSIFYANGINLTKIESRPIPGKDFEVMFYFDLDVPVYKPGLGAILDELKASSPGLAYLGSYSEVL